MYGFIEEKSLLGGASLWIREDKVRCDRTERLFLLRVFLIVFIEWFPHPFSVCCVQVSPYLLSGFLADFQ